MNTTEPHSEHLYWNPTIYTNPNSTSPQTKCKTASQKHGQWFITQPDPVLQPHWTLISPINKTPISALTISAWCDTTRNHSKTKKELLTWPTSRGSFKVRCARSSPSCRPSRQCWRRRVAFSAESAGEEACGRRVRLRERGSPRGVCLQGPWAVGRHAGQNRPRKPPRG